VQQFGAHADAMAGPLTVLDVAPQAIRSTPHGSQVGELLAVYQGVLDGVDDLPPVPMVLRKNRGRLHYRPRTKWPVRYFVVRHLQQTLDSLTRRYSARAALGQQADGEQQDREAVREFQQSLPPDRQKIYVLLLIAAIFIVLGYVTPPVVNSYENKPQGNSQIQQVKDTSTNLFQWLKHGSTNNAEAQQVEDASTKMFGAVVDPRTMNDAVNAVLRSGPLGWCLLTQGVMLSAYVVLRLLMPAFRLKRMIFNLAPEPEGRHRSAVARWSVSQSTGLYECERRVFAELGGRPPPEFPFDLAVSALAMVLPLILCALWVRGAIVTPELRTLDFGRTACALVAVLVRLGWLWRTWRRRQLGGSGPYTPYELRIRAGRAIAKVEQPVGVRLLVLLLFSVYWAVVGYVITGEGTPVPVAVGGLTLDWLVVLMAVSLPWSHRIKRELRDLDRSYEADKTRRRPLRSLLIGTMGRLISHVPFVGVLRVGRQIRRAQSRAGQPVTALSPWILTPGLLLGPVLLAYLQHELNKVWAVEGEPLDPWPAGTSREASRSTGTLPWLKAKGPNHRTCRRARLRKGTRVQWAAP
jgi:FtsH-binding integral membrane protein